GVDLATVVAVRARLREIGEDLGVARLEEDAVPERPRLRLGRQRALGLLGLLATVAVDGEKGLEELVARDHPAALGQELGKLALQEVFLHVDHVAPEAPALDLDGDVARGGVARLVLGDGGDGRPHLVVPGEGDDGDVEIGVGRPRGIRPERQGTDAHRHSGGASRAHDHEPAAALGPVARGRDDLDGERREVEGDGYGGRGPVADANGPAEAGAGAHLEHGAAIAQARGAAVDHEFAGLPGMCCSASRAMIAMRLAALGFLARAAAHLHSFTPWARLLGERTIWTLEVGVFLLALWMIARLRRTAAIRRQWGRVAVHDWRGLVAAVPPGLRFLVIGAALYAWMNFVLCLMVEEDVVTRAAITLRMATGHLLFFYLVPLVFFGWVDPARP